MGAKSKPNDSTSRYEAQKRRDWNTFSKYLNNHQPPLPLAKCSDVHVVEFCKHLDQFGKTKVHILGCEYYGRPNPNTSPESQCSCPLKQAWGSLDSLIGRLRAAYEENGGPPESNPFGARAVHGYLRGVREAQAKARGLVKKKRKEQSGITSSMVPLDQSSFHWLEERTETGMGSEETTNTIQNNVTSDVQMHVQISASKDQLSKGAQPNEPVVSHSNHMVEHFGTYNGKIQPILSRAPLDQSSFHWVEERTETGKGSKETNNTIPNKVSTDVQMHAQISASKDQLLNGAMTNEPVVSHSNHVLEYFGTYNGKIQSILSNVPLDQSSFHWVEERTETGKGSEETNNSIQNNVSSDVHMHMQISTSKDQLLNGAKPNEPVVSHSNHVLEYFGTYNGKIQPIPSISSRERERMNEENRRDEEQRALEREQSRIRSRRRRERMTEGQRVQERERRQFRAKMKKATMDDRQRALERERVRSHARERRQKIREVDKNKTAIERERERQRICARERRKKMTDDQKSFERERQRLRARERGGCMNSGNSMRERRERRRLLARKLRGNLYSGESEQFHEHEERRSPENEHLTEGGQGAQSMHQSSSDHDLAIQNASNCPSINDINQDIIHMQEHVQEGVSRMDGHTSTISLGMEPNCVTEGRTDLPRIRAANIGVNVECEIDACQNDGKNENSCQTSSVGLGVSACSLEPGFGTERTTELADQNNPTQGEVNHSIRSNQEVSQGDCQTVSGKHDREKLLVKKLNSKNISYVHNSLEGGGITYNRERSNRSFLEMLKKLTQPVLQKVYEPNSVNKNVDKDDDRIVWDIEHGEYHHVASGLRYNPVTDLYFKNFNATYGLFYKLEKGKLEIMKEGEEGDHNKYLCKDCEVDALANLEPSLIEREIKMLEQKAMEGYHQRALEMWSQRKRIRDVDDSSKSLERQQECQLMRARKCTRNMNDKQKFLEGEQQRFRGRQRSGGMNSGKSMCERRERQQLLARQLNGDTYSGECELQGRTNTEDLLEGRQETLSMHSSSTALSFEMCNKEIEKASRMDGDTSTVSVGLEPNCRTEGRTSSPQVTCENVAVNVECETNTLKNDGENDNSRCTSSVGLGISGCSVEPDFEIERTVMQADQDVSSHIDVEVDVDHSRRAHQVDRGDGWYPILGKHTRKKMPVKKSKLNSKNTGYVHNDFEGGGVTYSREENNLSSLEMLMEASQLVLEQVCEQHSEDEEVEEDVEIEDDGDEIMWDIEHEEYHHVSSGLRYNPVTDLYFKNFNDTYGLFYKCKKGKLEIVTEGEEGFHNKFLSKDCEGDGLNNLEPRLVKRVIRMLKQKSLKNCSGVGE